MKKIIIVMMLLVFTNIAESFSISCNYEKEYDVCNGYRLKKECRGEIELSQLLFLETIFYMDGLNDESREEYLRYQHCLEDDLEIEINEARRSINDDNYIFGIMYNSN